MLFLQFVNEKGGHILKPAADIDEIRLNVIGGNMVLFKDGTEAYMEDVMDCFIDIVGEEEEA